MSTPINIIMMNTIYKFRILHLINHIVAIAGIVMAITSQSYFWFAIGLVCFLWTGIVGVDVALHRYYSHKSFKASTLSEWIMLLTSIPTSLGSPAMWCSVHRLHHVTSDTDKDPHNPATNGPFKTWFAFWTTVQIPKRFFLPFLSTKSLRFIHNYYFIINFLILGTLMFIDFKLAAFVYALPAVLCFHGAAAIGVLPHLTGKWQLGYRRYNINDLSHNNWLASILSLGEGWHNNHHANPGRWWQGETWWEVDPPAFMIKHFFMKKEIT
jgi:stearoyl-CoA desaturase (delta-9 desaturase)